MTACFESGQMREGTDSSAWPSVEKKPPDSVINKRHMENEQLWISNILLVKLVKVEVIDASTQSIHGSIHTTLRCIGDLFPFSTFILYSLKPTYTGGTL